MKPLLASLLLALAALAIQPMAADPGPVVPCQSGIAGTDCGVTVGSCGAGAGWRTGSDPYEYVRARCGPPTFSGCTVYADTTGRVEQCLAATAAAPSAPAGYACSSGMEQSFCTLWVGPCHETSGSNSAGEVTHTWQSAGCTTPATGDCTATSYDHGVPVVSCAASPPDAPAAPCVSLPPHAGIDCTVGPVRCTILVWVDLNPPNPTFECPA